MKIKFSLFVFVIILFVNYFTFGQVHADFTANITEQCGAPMFVQFTNLSTGNGTLSYQWFFGNGISSNLANPSVISYVDVGMYTVTLIVTNGTDYDTLVRTNYIKVYALPTASFTRVPPFGCIPLSVNFTNTSQPGDTTITNFLWEFGDGSTSTTENPSYTYSQIGGYSVTLTVTDGHGCSSSHTIQNAVIASDKPHVEFVADNLSSCYVPFTVNFTNLSSGSIIDTLSYFWDFGDGGTSTLENPSHTYNVADTFSVTLQVTNQYGCSSDTTYENYINLTTVDASIETNFGDTVCPNQIIQFTNGAGTSSSFWDFGDGSFGVGATVNHTYTLADTSFLVMLIAAPNTPCADTAYKVIVTRPLPNAQFSVSSHFSCGNALTFTPVTTTAYAYEWHFGDSPPQQQESTSSDMSPVFTYTDNGTYFVTLNLTDEHGCIASYTDTAQILVEYPTTSINADVINGCLPLNVAFSDSSTCDTSYTYFTNWSWDFGDGYTDTLQNPSHIFQDTGVYNVTLTVYTNLGCSATTNIEIQVGEHHSPLIQLLDTAKCANDTMHFATIAPDSIYIDSYSWTLINDSNMIVGTGTDANPEIVYQGNGFISLIYITEHNGCTDTLHLDSLLYLNGPYTEHLDTVMFGCQNPYLIALVNPEIKQANRWYWDFDGDGVYDDSTKFSNNIYYYNDTAWFTYPSRGTYDATFIAYNDSVGCFWKEELTINVRDIYADINIQSPTCPNNVLIDINNSLDYDSISIFYGDNSYANLTQLDFYTNYTQYAYHNYPPHFDTLTAFLILWNNVGCRDTDSVTFVIFSQHPNFTTDDPLHFCPPFSIHFNDSSYADTTIVAWYWSINPGNLNDTAQNPTFNITNPGNYNVSLTITDALGCSATYSVNNYIQADLLQGEFSSSNNLLCVGDTIHFYSSNPIATDYVWDYGDGSPLDTAINPYHLYSDTGNYTVTLYLSNSNPGCKDTVIAHNYVQVQNINIDISALNTDTNCYPFPIRLINNTDTTYNPTWMWNFGDGSFSLLHTPNHIYTMPGTYWLTLEAITSFGCRDKDSLKITIGGPYTEMIMSDNIICKGDSVTFNVTETQGITDFTWVFNDGYADTGVSVTHAFNYYPSNGYFIPTLLYCNSEQCCGQDYDTIYLHQVIADFDYQLDNGSTDSTACVYATLLFTNTSLGADSVYWDFGDGSGDTAFVPASHYYVNNSSTQQTYFINLTVFNNQVGCIDSIKKPFVLYPMPTIQLGNDVAICKGSSVQLSASGGNAIVWTPMHGLNNPSSYSPTASPDSTTTYTATIYDIHGCSNSQSLTVFVQQSPSLYNSSDTTIIVGEYVNLWANSDQSSVTYHWSPEATLSCSDCPNPIAQPLHSTTYTVIITDSMNCFQITGTVHIEVKEEYTLDVPTAFTPNGDGNNDILYVRGWGLKQLLEFKIYNRWGECVFETDDLNKGWDGTFRGRKQDMDTYAYTVKALTFANKILIKNGLVNLLR